MLRKTVVLGSLLTLISASSTLAHGHFRSGFLAGAHIGVSSGYGTFNSNFDTNVPAFGSASGSAKGRETSPMFGILGGYRHVFHDGITVGLDISGNIYANNELSEPVTHSFPPPIPSIEFTNNLSRRYSVIPSINFGKIFCDRWHVGVGLGIGISGFKQEIIAPPLHPGPTTPTTATSTVRKLGFVPSLLET